MLRTPYTNYTGTPAARKLVMRRPNAGELDVEPCEELYDPDRVAAALGAKE